MNTNYQKEKGPSTNANESKNSLFITAEDKTFEEYSSLLHSINKKRKKQNFNECDASMTNKSRQ